MVQFRSEYEGPWAPFTNVLNIPTGTWRYQRPVTKVDKCSHCGWCALFCPGGSMEDRGNYFTADLDYCKGCGICARTCPVNAIMMIPEG
jgi:2-oxoacid:acceptor oxidoreductase delta subunit (pyruvate/2-ketoisovalerate family)